MSFYAMLSAFAFPVFIPYRRGTADEEKRPFEDPVRFNFCSHLGKDRRPLLEKIMKNLLATTAIAMVALTGAASAQSVLERVLGQIDNATNLASVNGTFANIAENLGGAGEVNVFTTENAVTAGQFDGEVISQSTYDAGLADAIEVAVDAAIGALGAGTYLTSAPDQADFDMDSEAGNDAYYADLAKFQLYTQEVLSTTATATTTFSGGFEQSTVVVSGFAGINGSISNIVDGIDEATQVAVSNSVSAVEFVMPTLDFGDMATTALGAVNTGDITLGVNSAVDEAKTTSTQAVSSVMNQLGGSADTGAIVLNIASNMTGINGSITNAMTEVNGTIGSLSTTALGAVNTGVIISGVDSAVQGIIGMSGSVN